jgi:hypothetical protein
MADTDGYDEDAARIERDYVSASSTTQAEVRADLSAVGFPESSIDAIAGSEGTDGWITTTEDAVDLVSPTEQSASSFARSIDRNTDGAVSETRARSMGETFEEQINAARSEAAQRIGSDGNIRDESGRILGSPSSVSEEIREDGIYFVNDNTGTEGRAAEIDLSARGGAR